MSCLTGETLPVIGSTTIGYDANANRTAATGGGGGGSASYSYTTGTNRITALTGTDPITGLPVSESLGYDAAGNPTSRTGATSDVFAYDAQGRLASIARNGVTLATYTYNSRNLRTSKTTAAGTVFYHYDQNGNLIQESNTAGTVLVSYVWVDGTPLAQITSTGGTDTPIFIHTDHLATPRLATNTAALPAWSWDSDGFGAVPANSDPLNTGTTTTVNLRFPGQYYDLETGLHYNWNRYYDPRTGRYITSDPIGLEGGANTYGYVGANPVVNADRTGLACGTGVCVGVVVGLARVIQAYRASRAAQAAARAARAQQAAGAIAEGPAGTRPIPIPMPQMPPIAMSPPDEGDRPGTGVKGEGCEDESNKQDKCNRKLTEWQLREKHIDAHAVKTEELGRRVRISHYDLCGCDDGRIVIRLRGCVGPIVSETGLTWK